MPEWLSQVGVRLLISALVMILGLWDRALNQAPGSAGSLLEILSLPLPLPLPPTHALSKQINKILEGRKERGRG